MLDNEGEVVFVRDGVTVPKECECSTVGDVELVRELDAEPVRERVPVGDALPVRDRLPVGV